MDRSLLRISGKIILTLFAVLLTASCAGRGEVSLLGVEDLDMSNLSRPELSINVKNSTGHNIHIKSGNLVMKKDGVEILEVKIAGKVTIPRKSSGNITIPLHMRMQNPLLLFALGTGNISLMDMTVSGEAVVKAGMGRKKIEVAEMTLREFITKFGIEKEYIEYMRGIGL